ncbi:uroporphyrinogen-III C-methyltransferase [Photobacterium galatheae]|uniref:uroporphyrinogen-III C-methyltransferase n=1 Tax=Photobacterium galatheae TaxID=1654360 RepID=A0A066RHQ4_9GAMM|nr:uroporphyrinogen-III C-methyltransferase [Photobacterium galatheae]KDM89849.1 uroporphyrin-III methyltransferase [Photobacterium galatheae]MCM0151144.1 uroporphyrinogen-III C-methyltransferase [Photobacterium galatheae]
MSMESTATESKTLVTQRHGTVRAIQPVSPRFSAPGQPAVSLVGAGPGDPELLTLKALKAIQQAEVLVYDRLVSDAILAMANPEAELIYVGKRCGQPSMKQEAINQLLIDKAETGRYVVRLKGGDPLIFGRGGEEGLALAEKAISFEFVPGITAAIGCAASTSIPLTHREMSRSVTLVTGHVVSGALPAWAQLIGAGQTIVFYMGLEQAREIQSGLTLGGLHKDTPLAVVIKGCTPDEQVHVSSLGNLTKLGQILKGQSPALLIIGDVVALRATLNQALMDDSETETNPKGVFFG